ncbi:hypothetical protein HTZ77_05455 [Nonomuraea sp. SMC257]|uniref:DUF4386 family protein n=1 Tax=Nonomuraea montanisoli TaxID=2741721 RepID=A0A7Y6I4B4_9ACTN|nr:hypothetical protein [Nonomuraea montanisoli]NUW30863.1 hypothetical protein [Nonomuraea montanisoli]
MFNDHVTFRRLAAGTLLIAAPLLQAVAVIVDPGTWGDDREAVSYGSNPALAQTESALYHWSWMLMAVAAIGLVHLTRQRATRLGHIAGAMTVIGYLNLSALLMMDPVEWWLGRHHPPEQAQKILDEMLDLPGVIVGFQMPWVPLGLIGLPLLTVAVWRSGFSGWWVPVTVVVGYGGGFAVDYGPITVVLWIIPVAGLGALGVKVLRMGDDAWAALYARRRAEDTPPPLPVPGDQDRHSAR